MKEIKVARRHRAPTHPGVVVRDTVIPAAGLTVTAMADALHVTRQQLHRVLAGRSGVSPEMALRLGKFCGNGPVLWMRMQEAYDLWHATEKIGADVEKIRTLDGLPEYA